ncbi:hypothetical protein CC1G_07086 [Coprinopsis cinerea okayama7|uniref:Endonuclease/exonuclease/phosphatase domain-containing protein n=1 Tax=Coprinopsis cinerea (strain Okayama-7 / 130 / ATCC MYA-4618 / FGSC 9003) TaxID=240176 RepID=A8NUE8_COPC7|nr:hypothetical protein CC1G_07086 [Coprinopsis cinerea okayama7\|eukprot:XP_001836439.2 hypothetical protein CC1G_07086 [Coprinopsis cinerea okayama7\
MPNMYPRFPTSWANLSHWNRPTAPVIIEQKREKTPSPFIPPIDTLDQEPVVPNTLYPIKAYRYRSSRQRWKHLVMPTEEQVQALMDDEEKKYPTTLRIITWNVDFTTPDAKTRLKTALRHIEREVLSCKEGDLPFDPCCILLQEVHRDVFCVLLEDEWVRRHFIIAPGSPDKWPEGTAYGNVTLVSRVLTVVRSEILHYGKTYMGRTALAVYILLSEPEPSAEIVTICVVNTHLESLSDGFAYRSAQMELAGMFLQQAEVRGGVVAGDMNAISPEDHTLHMGAGLKDAWRKGNEDEGGFTWGYQEHNPTQYPPGRLDKILYLPRRGYKMDPPERVGVGVKTEEGTWVSDHYGLDSTLRLVARRNSQ